MIDNLYFLEIAKNCNKLQENAKTEIASLLAMTGTFLPLPPPKGDICVSDCSGKPHGTCSVKRDPKGHAQN